LLAKSQGVSGNVGVDASTRDAGQLQWISPVNDKPMTLTGGRALARRAETPIAGTIRAI